jgi:DNA-binding NtrC family response regulator
MADSPPDADPPVTAAVAEAAAEGVVRSFVVTVVEGAAGGASFTSTSDRCGIGSHALNDLCIDDKTVSRFHCEIRLEERAAVVKDLGSRNRTVVDGLVVREAELRDGSLVRLGNSVVRFHFGTRTNRLALSTRTELGGLVGRSAAMRMTFAWLERAAQSDVTVLLEGETGSGKGAAAAAIHKTGGRKDRPLVVVDCAAIPTNLLESELFGHERGAFTGAELRRIGAFEEADGGTVFLDEIGELPVELQPKLLRVLESREIRRVGSNAFRPVDVRVIAATNRDLRAEVNGGRFRPDLYFRLAVVKIALPPLRSRPEDVPLLVERMLDSMGATDEQRAPLRRAETVAELARAAWPGNVRELRNFVEHALLFPDELGGDTPLPPAPAAPTAVDARLPFAEARTRALAEFERSYLEKLLELHHGKVTAAATAAGIGRVYLWKLLKKYGLGR